MGKKGLSSVGALKLLYCAYSFNLLTAFYALNRQEALYISCSPLWVISIYFVLVAVLFILPFKVLLLFLDEIMWKLNSYIANVDRMQHTLICCRCRFLGAIHVAKIFSRTKVNRTWKVWVFFWFQSLLRLFFIIFWVLSFHLFHRMSS